jgi:predicted dehydrogenase
MAKLVQDRVRFGVIGLGVMGRLHASSIAHAADAEFCLSAVADANDAAAKAVGQQLTVPHFTDAQAMLDSGLVDTALIAAPHYLHAPLTIRAARAGVHVLCEKPMAVEISAARLMVQECQRHGVALGVVLQQRCRPIMMRISQMIRQGMLGEIYHANLTCSHWYRTQAYYDSGTWRGTWAGEGGGILTNQAPHHLDLMRWFLGRPQHVSAFLSTRIHRIEVENTANVMLEYEGGRSAQLYFTTAESPKREQLVITGDRGTLVAEGNELRFGTLSEPLAQHVHGCRESSADHIVAPECKWERVPLEPDPADLRFEVIRAFARHLRHGEPMAAGGEDAAGQVELANAIYLSGYGRQIVDLPLDEVHERNMRELLDRLARESRMAGTANLRDVAAAEMARLLSEEAPRELTGAAQPNCCRE